MSRNAYYKNKYYNQFCFHIILSSFIFVNIFNRDIKLWLNDADPVHRSHPSHLWSEYPSTWDPVCLLHRSDCFLTSIDDGSHFVSCTRSLSFDPHCDEGFIFDNEYSGLFGLWNYSTVWRINIELWLSTGFCSTGNEVASNRSQRIPYKDKEAINLDPLVSTIPNPEIVFQIARVYRIKKIQTILSVHLSPFPRYLKQVSGNLLNSFTFLKKACATQGIRHALNRL